jgi:hypothetical protein
LILSRTTVVVRAFDFASLASSLMIIMSELYQPAREDGNYWTRA